MTDETRQALDEVERRIRDEILVEMTEAAQGKSTHSSAWLQGSQSGMRFALRMIADVRSEMLDLGDSKQYGPPIVTVPDYLRPAKIEHVADAPFPPKRSTLGDEAGAEGD